MSKNHYQLHSDGELFAIHGYQIVEFRREPIDKDALTGFALAWNDRFTLIHEIDRHQFRLNGYAVFRSKDVKRYRVVSKGEFLAGAAKIQRLRPSLPKGLDIRSMRAAVETAGRSFPLITIHNERLERDACYIGKLLKLNQRTLTIRAISPTAKWEKEEAYALKNITLLQFGGIYESLLLKLAKQANPQ